MISTDELSEIFSNVDEIVLATQNLVTKLDTFIDEYLHSQDETVGKVFLDEVFHLPLTPFFSPLSPFIH